MLLPCQEPAPLHFGPREFNPSVQAPYWLLFRSPKSYGLCPPVERRASSTSHGRSAPTQSKAPMAPRQFASVSNH